MTQQHFYRSRRQGVASRLCFAPTVGVHQDTTLIDEFDLRPRNPGMVLDCVDALEPDEDKKKTKTSHEPEATLPSGHVNDPSKDRRKDHQREILRRVEDRRGASTLFCGEPRGDDAAV